MAVGDDAVGAGMATVPGTLPANELDTEINRTRDYIALRTSAVTPIAKGGTGATTAAAARAALGVASENIGRPGGDTVEAGLVWLGGQVANANAAAGSAAAAAANAQSGVDTIYPGQLSSAVYSRVVGGNSVYVSPAGLLGYLPSTRDKKTGIVPADIPVGVLRAVLVRCYEYKPELELGDRLRLGLIVDELEALGLGGLLVEYAPDGEPMTVHYELVGLLALLLAQHEADRLDDIEMRLAAGGL